MVQINNEYVAKQMNEIAVNQRIGDGYINATALCKAAGKEMKHYLENSTTKEFSQELSSEVGIPTSELIQIVRGGIPHLQGTWVHPYVAINLGQWLSPKFAVQVSKWVHDWMTQGFSIELAYQKHEAYKKGVEETGSSSGRFLANLRWHINPDIKEKDRYFEENRQMSLFFEPEKIAH